MLYRLWLFFVFRSKICECLFCIFYPARFNTAETFLSFCFKFFSRHKIYIKRRSFGITAKGMPPVKEICRKYKSIAAIVKPSRFNTNSVSRLSSGSALEFNAAVFVITYPSFLYINKNSVTSQLHFRFISLFKGRLQALFMRCRFGRC